MDGFSCKLRIISPIPHPLVICYGCIRGVTQQFNFFHITYAEWATLEQILFYPGSERPCIYLWLCNVSKIEFDNVSNVILIADTLFSGVWCEICFMHLDCDGIVCQDLCQEKALWNS